MKKIYETPVSDVILLLDEEIHMFEVSNETLDNIGGEGKSFNELF